MGLKSLSLQMIPWCFHVVGATCRANDQKTLNPAPVRTVRLIGSDGKVKVYHRPVNVAELMKEYPRHLICHSDSFYIGQKVPALSASDDLQLGHSYFLLPTHFFHSVLSFVTVTSSLIKPNPVASPNSNSTSKRTPLLRAFDIHKTAAGTLQIRVSDELMDRIKEEEEEEERRRRGSSRVCTTEELEKDYRQLVRCKSRQWKPRLETIRESERRRNGWSRRGGAFGGFKRRKKKTQC